MKETLFETFKSVKSKYHNEENPIVLIRANGFYITYQEDAVTIAEILGIMLTRSRVGNSEFAEKAGFPYHCLDSYLPKLVRAGKKIVICE